MKRTAPWDDVDELSSDSDDVGQAGSSRKSNSMAPSKDTSSERKKKARGIDYEALSRHGYRGGFSVLGVPPQSTDANQEPDWTWSDGRNKLSDKGAEETVEEREKTRATVAEGEKLLNVQTKKEKKNHSFSQKEKRKRELGCTFQISPPTRFQIVEGSKR